MKHLKKLTAIVLSVIMAISATAISASADDAYSGKTVVIVSSNLRGDITAIPKIASIKSAYEEAGAEVILADSGNFLQGSVYSNADKGYSMLCLMETAGYDVISLGKYDFAFGNGQMGAKPHGSLVQYFTLADLVNGGSITMNGEEITKEPSQIKVISTNAEGTNAYYSFEKTAVITTESGRKIGFAGITNPNTPNAILEESLSGIGFGSAENAKKAAEELKGEADEVITLAGYSASGVDIAESESSPASVKAIVIGSSGRYIESLSLDNYEPLASLQSEVDKIKERVSEKFPEVAKSTVRLNGSTKAVRSGETNLGNLFTDALLDFAVSGKISGSFSADYLEGHAAALDVPRDNIVAIWNGGNLRDYIYAGDVIKQDVERVLPYPNTVAVAYVKGSTLLEALEAAMQYDAAFPSVAGMCYNIDTKAELKLGANYLNSAYFAPNGINKVSIKSVHSKPFDKNATYAVITSNMIFNGGDTYGALADKLDGSTITSAKVTNVVWNYINNELGGVISEKYAKTEGRITKSHTHSYSSKTTQKATCGKAGVKTLTCKVCGATKTESIKATGKHTYDNGKVTKAPTSSKAGTMTYTCKVCGKRKTESIKKLAKASISKLTAKKKGFTAKWKRVSSATGYQLEYSTSSKFSNSKKITISKNTTLSKSVKKLKAKKKYYVRIRTYRAINGKKYYSAWSGYKKVTTKK